MTPLCRGHERYHVGKEGGRCQSHQAILTKEECLSALEYISNPKIEIHWEGKTRGISRGCSIKAWVWHGNPHFNNHKDDNAKGRDDITPICKGAGSPETSRTNTPTHYPTAAPTKPNYTCFYRTTAHSDYAGSRANCKKTAGADIASIHSAYENSVVQTLTFHRHSFIGTIESKNNGHGNMDEFVWSDGSAWDYTAPYNDGLKSGETRIVIHRGMWHDWGTGNGNMPAVCRINTNVDRCADLGVMSILPPPAGAKTCFFPKSARTDYDSARLACQNTQLPVEGPGADIASIHSDAENQVAMSVKIAQAYIGAIETKNNGGGKQDDFIWSDGTAWDYITKYHDGLKSSETRIALANNAWHDWGTGSSKLTALCRVETTPSACASLGGATVPVVEFPSPVVDFDVQTLSGNTWHSTGSAPGVKMDVSGFSVDPTKGPFFNANRGRAVNYNVSPNANAELSWEIWFDAKSLPHNRCWILGHDNGGYDRGLNLCDNRFGGIAAPRGGTYKSSHGFAKTNTWYHIVVTYKNGAHDNKVFVQEVGSELKVDTFHAANGNGNSAFTVGGLNNYGNHHVDAFIPIVRVYNERLTQADVEKLYAKDAARFSGP